MRRAGLLPMPADATASDRRSLQDLYRKLEKLSPTDRKLISDMIDRMSPE